MSDGAEELTPEWWIGLWNLENDDTYERTFARSQWDAEYGGEGDHLDPALPAADLQRLLEGSEAVRDHVDEHIAHSEDPGPEAKDPGPTSPESTLTLNDVHDAIEVIGDVFRRYYSLFEAAGMPILEPAIQHDWLAPFREPWIRSDE